MDVFFHCINEIAIEYHIPARLILAILQMENGRVGHIIKNKNNTYDIGPMGINSIWLTELEKYNITEYDIKYNICINIKVAVWILSKKIAARNNLFVGIGDYNSHTYKFNKLYYEKVTVNFASITRMLDNH